MSKQIKQFRFFKENDINNYPSIGGPSSTSNSEDININSLFTGNIFTPYMPITQLGIQSLPGTKFYLNDNLYRTNPIILGYTGLYELNLENISEINSLSFDLESLTRINSIEGAYLIIDIIYDKDEEE